MEVGVEGVGVEAVVEELGVRLLRGALPQRRGEDVADVVVVQLLRDLRLHLRPRRHRHHEDLRLTMTMTRTSLVSNVNVYVASILSQLTFPPAYFDDDPPAPPPPARTRAKPASAPAPPRPPPPAVRPPASSASSSIPSCECAQRAASRTVSKESIHKGRQFYTCPNTPPCGFFQWADGMAVVPIPSTSRAAASSSSAASGSQNAAADSSDKQCRCPHPAVQRQVQKEGPTKGKMFWTCPNPQAEQCGYFEWADGTSGASSGGSGSNECFKCGRTGHWASGKSS